MYNKHFGLYLLSRGLLDQSQFFNVAADVHDNQQKSCPGRMDSSCSSPLIKDESLLDSYLCVRILEKGYLTNEQLIKAIFDYETECSLIDQEGAGFDGLDYSVIVRVLLSFSDAKWDACRSNLFYDYIALLLNSMVKILHDEPAIWEAYELTTNPPAINEEQAWTISQAITVDGKRMHTNLIGEERTLLMLASRYSKENLLDMNEFVLDCAIEFFNVNNGLFVANLSNKGMNAEIDLVTINRGNSYRVSDGCVIPIGLIDGQLYLVLSF